MPTISATANTEFAIFARLLEPHMPTLPLPLARMLLDLEFGQADLDRMHQLALKAQDGTLTPDEREEIDNYERVGTFLSILKSKARLALRAREKRNDR